MKQHVIFANADIRMSESDTCTKRKFQVQNLAILFKLTVPACGIRKVVMLVVNFVRL